MANTIFSSPTAVGAKIITISTTVTNTSGAYSATINDMRLTSAMKAIKLELSNPEIFGDKISVNCSNAMLTISCNEVSGTSTVGISVMKVCDDPTSATSTEFDILNNTIGDIDDLETSSKSNLVGAVNDVQAQITTINNNVGTVQSGQTVEGQITALNSNKMNIPTNSGSHGQLLQNDGNGGAEWANVGTPSDAQVGTAVSTWLTAHPEATTTVQDGAITRTKLDDDLKEKTDAVPDLKSAVTTVGDENGIYPFLPSDGGYITTNGSIGSSVSYTVTAHNNFKHIVLDCTNKKEIIVNGRGWTTARLWCLVDSDDKILVNSAASITASGLRLLVPNNATKCIINTFISDLGYVYLINNNVENDLRTEFDYLNNQIETNVRKKESRNLFDPSGEWNTVNGCRVTFTNESVTITTVASGTYQDAKHAIDVAGINKITASYGNVEGTGDAVFRIVALVNGTWTTITAESVNSKFLIYDVSSYDTIYVQLNVTTGTSKASGTYLTYHDIQIQSGDYLTEYIPKDYYKISSFEDKTARSCGIVEESPNLINKYGTWYSNGATVEILENGDIKVISKVAGNYQYAYVLFDASKSQKFISQYELGEKTGDALFRIGYFENNTPTFKTAPTRIWNLENHPVGILALYVTVETSKPKGTYVTYKNVMVQQGMVDSNYSEYGTNVMRNHQAPCINSIVKTITHRGDFFLAPQCTAPAYIEARKRGITIAENDLNRTSDGTYVVWHETTLINCGLMIDINGYEMYTDGTEFYYYDRDSDKLYTYTTEYVQSSKSLASLTRCNGEDYEISAMNYAVLKRVDCGAYYAEKYKGTQILSFEEWVSLCRTLGMDIYIDRKVGWTEEEAEILVGIVKKYSMLDHATWFTGSVGLSELIRQFDPNARLAVLTWPTAELIEQYSSFNTGRGFVFNGDIKSIDKNAITLGLNSGFQVEGWYVDFWQQKNKQQALAIIRDAVDAGCQAITTDHYRVDEAYGDLYGMYL